MRRQIDQLEKREREQNGKLATRDKQLLETLKSDLVAFEKGSTNSEPGAPSTEGYTPRRRFVRRNGGRGKLSIYWDPILKYVFEHLLSFF